MATIQVRDIPESVHRIYKARAAAAGKSLQEYLRAELIEGARLRAPSEIAAEVEAEVSSEEAAGYATVSATALVRDDRDAR